MHFMPSNHQIYHKFKNYLINMLQSSIVLDCLLSCVGAQTPTMAPNMAPSLCDKYVTALTGASNIDMVAFKTAQETVLRLLVNTAFAGNVDFTLGGVFYAASRTNLNADVFLGKTGLNGNPAPLGIKVTGFLNLNGTGSVMVGNMKYKGDLLQYFIGTGATTNVGGQGARVNFIDIGVGPFAGSPNYPYTAAEMVSKQYLLMVHLYQIFSALLGCSLGYPSYDGSPSMFQKHRFMQLSHTQNLYFILQVGLAAVSYGVTVADATAVGTALGNLYNSKDAPAYSVNAKAGLTTSLQSCCQDGVGCVESTPATGGAPTPQAYADAVGVPSPASTPMPTTAGMPTMASPATMMPTMAKASSAQSVQSSLLLIASVMSVALLF
jgi:hypothetical protein